MSANLAILYEWVISFSEKGLDKETAEGSGLEFDEAIY